MPLHQLNDSIEALVQRDDSTGVLKSSKADTWVRTAKFKPSVSLRAEFRFRFYILHKTIGQPLSRFNLARPGQG